jgi:hypothetical protein
MNHKNNKFMKRKVISIIGLALFVGAIAFNVHMNAVNNDQLSDVTLKNIEALAAPGDEMTEEEYQETYCCDPTINPDDRCYNACDGNTHTAAVDMPDCICD